MTDRQCSWCRYLKFLESQDLAGQLQAYVENLPAELRTEETEYARRLAVCGGCPRYRGGLCAVCGCFTAVRAARADQGCPFIGADKWKQ